MSRAKADREDTAKPAANADACLLCGRRALTALPVRLETGVTSDGRPWPFVGEFCVCRACGHLQKRLDRTWRANVAAIYDSYEMYALSDGDEPLVFEGGGGQPRTGRLLRNALTDIALPPRGRLLDVGCGNGAFLRTFGERFPGWELSGCDQQEDRRQAVLRLPGVREFHCRRLEDLPGIFDMVTMLYVIEHLFSPLATLDAIRDKLAPGGLLLVHTSDPRENPFDLPVVDHCSHFTLEILTAMVRVAGFEVLAASAAWNEKEIGVLARAANIPPGRGLGHFPQPQLVAATQLPWLAACLDQARAAARGVLFGFYGTANAAVWLAAGLDGEAGARFFLDDDRTKQGKACLGRPILDVADAPPGASVYMAFPPRMARRVATRASERRGDIRYIIPPDYGPDTRCGR